MEGTQPKSRFNKLMEIFLWLVALGVLAENVFLFLQNRRLSDALAPQITAGAQLQMLSGLALDGRPQQVTLPESGSNLLIITFSPGCPACQANQDGWKKLANTLELKGVRVLWVSRDPIEITRDYCSKHGIPLSDVRPTEPLLNSDSCGFPTLCWWVPRAEWRRCGQAVWTTQAGTRCLHILASGKRQLLLSKARLAPTQPAAGRSCPKRPSRAVNKT